MSVSHIASPVVVIGDRHIRQRCGWCGETLLEYDLARVAVPVGTDPMPATWPVDGVVRVDGNMSHSVEVNVLRPELPDDACARNPLTFTSFSG